MRHLLRTLLTGVFAASLALAGTAGIASAAPGNDNGNGTSYEMYEDWCFDDITVLLCFEVHGRWTIVDQNNGDQIGTAAVRTISYVVENGQVVSATVDHSVFQSKFIDGVAQDELIISNVRQLEPGGQCVLHATIRLDGGVIVVDQFSMACN